MSFNSINTANFIRISQIPVLPTKGTEGSEAVTPKVQTAPAPASLTEKKEVAEIDSNPNNGAGNESGHNDREKRRARQVEEARRQPSTQDELTLSAEGRATYLRILKAQGQKAFSNPAHKIPKPKINTGIDTKV